MKKIIFALAVIPFLSSRCNKDTGSGEWLEGKVVRISCASFVVQLLNNDSIGEDGWKDIMDTNKTYDDVITASNKCDIPELAQKDKTIRFKIEMPKTHNDCYICMLYDAPPQKAFEITDIEIKQSSN